MAFKTKAELILYVNNFIKQNNNNEITGNIMNIILIDIIESFFSSSSAETTYIQPKPPIDSLGKDSDTYIDSTDLLVYKKESGSWVGKIDLVDEIETIASNIAQDYSYTIDNNIANTSTTFTEALDRLITKIDGGIF